MKSLVTLLALVISCALLSCNTQPSTMDVDMTILFDMTDNMPVFPSANEIISQLNLKGQPYQQIRIKVSTISDRDVNNIAVFSLEKEDEWSSNTTIREAKIQHFSKQLQQCFNAIAHTDTTGHSIIYRAVVAQANGLATTNAKRKFLIVYSNLYENSEINFYSRSVLATVQNSPADIQQRLEQQVSIQQLKGVDTWLIYSPTSFRDNNHYRLIAAMYQRIFNAHGSTVHLATKFQPL